MINQVIFSSIVAVVAFWCSFQIYGQAFRTKPTEIGSVALKDTIRSIKRELAEIAATPGETAGLVLKTAKVQLTTQRAESETSKAELAVPIFEEASLTAESETKLTSGSKLTVVFVAPSGGELLAAGETSFLDLSALVLAARQALLATRLEEVELAPKTVEIEVSFLLVRSNEGGAAFKAHVVDIGGSISQVESANNKITLTYVDPALIAHDHTNGAASVPVPPK